MQMMCQHGRAHCILKEFFVSNSLNNTQKKEEEQCVIEKIIFTYKFSKSMVVCSFNLLVGRKLIEKILDIKDFIKSSKLKHYQVTTIYISVTNTWVIEYHHI